MFNSAGERRLAARLLEMKDPGPVVGMGFVQHDFDAAAFRDRFPVRGDFLLYAGRREEGKNTPLLVDYFRRFSARRPGLLSLVLLEPEAWRCPSTATASSLTWGAWTSR